MSNINGFTWTNEDTDAKLTEAYHTVFDIKDAAWSFIKANEGDLTLHKVDDLRLRCYETINQLSDLMRQLGYVVPERYDGDGR